MDKERYVYKIDLTKAINRLDLDELHSLLNLMIKMDCEVE